MYDSACALKYRHVPEGGRFSASVREAPLFVLCVGLRRVACRVLGLCVGFRVCVLVGFLLYGCIPSPARLCMCVFCLLGKILTREEGGERER